MLRRHRERERQRPGRPYAFEGREGEATELRRAWQREADGDSCRDHRQARLRDEQRRRRSAREYEPDRGVPRTPPCRHDRVRRDGRQGRRTKAATSRGELHAPRAEAAWLPGADATASVRPAIASPAAAVRSSTPRRARAGISRRGAPPRPRRRPFPLATSTRSDPPSSSRRTAIRRRPRRLRRRPRLRRGRPGRAERCACARCTSLVRYARHTAAALLAS
jgi:hypothetical protein